MINFGPLCIGIGSVLHQRVAVCQSIRKWKETYQKDQRAESSIIVISTLLRLAESRKDWTHICRAELFQRSWQAWRCFLVPCDMHQLTMTWQNGGPGLTFMPLWRCLNEYARQNVIWRKAPAVWRTLLSVSTQGINKREEQGKGRLKAQMENEENECEKQGIERA